METQNIQVVSDGICLTEESQKYRILVVVSQKNMETMLTAYAKILANRLNGEIGFLHDHDTSNTTEKRICYASLPISQQNKAAFRRFNIARDLESKIMKVAGIWPFDMLLAPWVDTDNTIGMIARSAKKINATAVLIRKGKHDTPIRRILVPVSGGAHSWEGTRIAHTLAEELNIPATVLRIIRSEGNMSDNRQKLKKHFRHIRHATKLMLDVSDVDMGIKIRLGNDIVYEITSHSKENDMVILGGSNQWLMENYASTSIPGKVAKELSGIVLMVVTNSSQQIMLNNIFWERTIYQKLKADSKISAITLLIDALIDSRQIPFHRRNEILNTVIERENSASTYIGNKTAIPHAAIKGFSGITGVMGIFPEGVPFGNSQKNQTNFVFLLLTPKENYDVYLPILSQIAQLMHSSQRRNSLLIARNTGEVTALIRNAEEEWLTMKLRTQKVGSS